MKTKPLATATPAPLAQLAQLSGESLSSSPVQYR